MVDIHNHILPGIDDGAIDEQMTLNMLKMAEEDGISIMVATPHYFSPRYTMHQEEVDEKVRIANQIAKDNKIGVKVLAGREIMLDKYTLEHVRSGAAGSLANTQYLLVELSMNKWDPEYLNTIYELQIMGYTVIIAHPERYSYVQEDITILNPLIKEGVIFQLNAGSIMGEWGNRVKRVAKELIKQGAVQLLASDAHSDTSRAPKIKDALAEVSKIDPIVAKQMKEYPYEILGEKTIHPNKVFIYKRRTFGIFDKLISN